jgi:ABC-type transporter Mla MlaB component
MKNNGAINVVDSSLSFSGGLTFYTVTSLTTQAVQLFLQQPSIVALDFKDIKECDSAGLVLLLGIWRAAKKNKRVVKFLNLPSGLLRLIKLSDLETIITNK